MPEWVQDELPIEFSFSSDGRSLQSAERSARHLEWFLTDVMDEVRALRHALTQLRKELA